MLRRIRLAFAASFILAACHSAFGQDAPSAAGPADSSATAGDDVAKLKAENAALKKEVADATTTIGQLQAKLAQAGAGKPAAATLAETTGESSTKAAPSGPLKALPLDSTNAVANPVAPGTAAANAGPGKSYTVVKGDSIWKIAHKMYPHDTLNGEDKIRDANKNVLNGKFLQPGQVLVIPQ